MRTDIAAITRDPVTKTARITVTSNSSWTLFSGPDAERIDFSRPLSSGNGSGTAPLPDAGTNWLCFALVTELYPDTSPLLLAERRLPMAGGYNFRDLGGFSGADGKRVVWGKLFRSDGLNSLTDADLVYLASIPIITLVDFRTDKEAWQSPDKVPASVKTVAHLTIAPGHLTSNSWRIKDHGSPDEFMLDMYRELSTDKGIAGAYRRFFAMVLEKNGSPLLFHCSAGKDRTGIAAALILFALGVERETILADYEASNICLGDKYAAIIKEHPDLESLLSVKRAFLERALNLIEAEYGSIMNYLETVLDVDITAMRRRFLM